MPNGGGTLIQKKREFKDLPMVQEGASILFFLSFGIFILGIALYGGLFLYNRVLKNQIETIKADLVGRRAEFNQGVINQMVSLDKRLFTARVLLSQHIFSSNIFNLIENLTHPNVRFKTLLYSADAKKIDMDGESSSYAVLARQIGIFEGDPSIERVEFGGLSLGDKGLVNFKLSLVFKSDFLRLNPLQ